MAPKSIEDACDILRAPDLVLRDFETELYKYIETRYPAVFKNIAEKKVLDDQVKAALDRAVKECAGDFAARKSAAA